MEGRNFFEVRKCGERAIGNEETGDEEGEGEDEGERGGEWMAVERCVEIFGRDGERAQVDEEFFGGVNFAIRVVARDDALAVGVVGRGENMRGLDGWWGCGGGVEGLGANEEVNFHLQFESDFVFALRWSASALVVGDCLVMV